MSFHRHRLTALERRQRRQHPPKLAHHLPIAYQPWDETDRERWLAELRCPCGVSGCPELNVGCILPEKAPSPEAWAEHYQRYARARGEP
jgi:hypothetical protein